MATQTIKVRLVLDTKPLIKQLEVLIDVLRQGKVELERVNDPDAEAVGEPNESV